MATYTEGTKFDGDKLRMDLLPPEAIEGLATILTFGAKKYADRNWEKGIKWGRLFGATMRHLWAWWRGEALDAESGYSHLWHALTDIAFLLTYEARGMKDFDDRPITHPNGTGRNYLHSDSGSGIVSNSPSGAGSPSSLHKDSVVVVRAAVK